MSTRKLIINSFQSVAAKLFNALIQVFCLPVLMRVYGKENYGLIVIAISLNTFIAIIQLGLPTGIPKFVAEWLAKGERGQLKHAIRTVSGFYIFIAILNGLALLGIAIWGIGLFNVEASQAGTLKSLLIVTAVTSFFSIPATVLDQILTGAHELGFVSRMQMIKNGLFGTLVAYVCFAPWPLTIVQFYSIQCFLMFVMIPAKLWRWKKYGGLSVLIPGCYIDSVWPLLKYSFSVLGFSLFMAIARKLCPVILAMRTHGNSGGVMADFQVINYVQLFLMMVAGSFSVAMVPHISRAVAGGDIHMYRKAMTQGTRLVWSLGALMGFGVIMLAREVIIVYVGEEFLYLQPWLIVYVIALLYNLYNPAMSSVTLASGKLLPLVVVTGVGCVVSLICCWFLAPKFGVGSVSIAFLVNNIICFLFMNFWFYPTYFNLHAVHQVSHILAPPVLAGGVMCLLGRWIIREIGCVDSWINIALGAVCGTLVYSAIIVMIYIRPVEIREILLKFKRA